MALARKHLFIVAGVALTGVALAAVARIAPLDLAGAGSKDTAGQGPVAALTRSASEPGASPDPTRFGRTATVTAGERRLAEALKTIQSDPDKSAGYNILAAAWLQRARETGDFGLNSKAADALKRSLELEPGNAVATKLEAVVHLTYHRFADGLEVIRGYLQSHPRDWEAYGALVDALIELGRYPEAIAAAQVMVDLRPNTASYSRISYIRSLHGDTAGAIEAMRMAVAAANPDDREGLAWCLVHLGIELMGSGDLEAAGHEIDRALFVFPDYPAALAAKARVLQSRGDFTGAIALHEQAQARAPLPDTVAALGDLYAKVGRTADAERQYQLVEVIERVGAAVQEEGETKTAQPAAGPSSSAQPAGSPAAQAAHQPAAGPAADPASQGDPAGAAGSPTDVAARLDAAAATYSRQLALFWADHDRRLEDALAIARRERAARADIFSSDALAWCLYKNGKLKEARTSIDEALRLGTRDPRLLYHAGMIHAKLGDRAVAKKYLTAVLEIDPGFDVLQADTVRKTLATL